MKGPALFSPLTDWHCHLLPQLDDGPATMDEAVVMAAGLRKAGFSAVYCTPHLIKGVFEADNRAVRSSLAALQQRLIAEQIDLCLFPGREYYLDEFLFDYLQDPLTVGGDRNVLMEIPNSVPADFIQATCFRIRSRGYTPVIAHPERCHHFRTPATHEDGWLRKRTFRKAKDLHGAFPLLSYLIEVGCRFQGNLRSFTGCYGEEVLMSAETMREQGIYSCYGTDAHSLRGIKGIRCEQHGQEL